MNESIDLQIDQKIKKQRWAGLGAAGIGAIVTGGTAYLKIMYPEDIPGLLAFPVGFAGMVALFAGGMLALSKGKVD